MKKSLFVLSLFASLILVGCGGGGGSSDGDSSSSPNNTTDNNGSSGDGTNDNTNTGKTKKSLTVNKVEDIYGYKVTALKKITAGDVTVTSDMATTFYCDGSSRTVQKVVGMKDGQKLMETTNTYQSDGVTISDFIIYGEYPKALSWEFKSCEGECEEYNEGGNNFSNIGLKDGSKIIAGEGLYGGMKNTLKTIEKIENCN